jgi:hypothetical protein
MVERDADNSPGSSPCQAPPGYWGEDNTAGCRNAAEHASPAAVDAACHPDESSAPRTTQFVSPRAWLLTALVVLAALTRLVPHPPNFAPIGAMALFGAFHFRGKWAALLVPLAAMFLSDLALEATTRLGLQSGWMAHGQGFHAGMWSVYAAFALIAVLGLLLRRKKSVPRVAAALLGSSVLFFLVTNFAVWAEGTLYPRTAEGLVTCYIAAVPFFHWTVLGDLAYGTALFGGFALAERWYPAVRTSSFQLTDCRAS